MSEDLRDRQQSHIIEETLDGNTVDSLVSMQHTLVTLLVDALSWVEAT